MKFTKSDGAVTVLTLVLVGVLLHFFFLEFNRTGYREGLDQAGTIVFRQRIAVRRSVTGLMWERIRNRSPVYNGDLLRTGGGAEATVLFEGGGGLDLLENTMLQLNLAGSTRIIDIRGGSLVLTGSGNPDDRPTELVLEGRRLSLSHDASAAVTVEGNRLELDVGRGTLSLEDGHGGVTSLGEGAGFKINLNDGSRELVRYELIPEYPAHNARFLILGSGSAEVAFSCGGNTDGALLEISGNSGFDSLFAEIPVSADGEAVVALTPGVYFWRVRRQDAHSPVRKINLYGDVLPGLVTPTEDARFTYRREVPPVLFTWGPTEFAFSYRFELSRKEDFSDVAVVVRSTLSSLRTKLPGEGIWYWRVVPEYPFASLADLETPEARRLVLEHSESMDPLVPMSPLEGTLISREGLEGQGIHFSWRPEEEAQDYEIIISPSSGGAATRYRSVNSQLHLSGEESVPFREPGSYFWELVWRDKEGALSPPGERRSFHVLESGVTLHLSYPPDGYVVADSLASSTRFAWKSDIPARTVVEVARDGLFTEPVLEETVQAETLLGRSWSSGTYQWRVTTYNSDGSVFLRSEVRSFHIVDPFPGPALMFPDPRGVHILREEDPEVLRWQDIPGADYYRLTLMEGSGGGRTMVVTPPVKEAELSLPLGDYPPGEYVVRIQAFSTDKPESTRIIGYIGETPFRFRILSYVTQVSPGEGLALDGLEARRRGVAFLWRSKDQPDTGDFVLLDGQDRPIARRKNPPKEIHLPRLDPGRYRWGVNAFLNGFDISSREWQSFMVSPIPPLPPPDLIEPSAGLVIGPEILREQRWISFDWKPVDGATHYQFSLHKAENPEPLFWTLLEEPDFDLDDLALLDRGEFSWTVTALAYDSSGDLEIPGTQAEGSFAISLPLLAPVRVPSGGEVYGY